MSAEGTSTSVDTTRQYSQPHLFATAAAERLRSLANGTQILTVVGRNVARASPSRGTLPRMSAEGISRSVDTTRQYSQPHLFATAAAERLRSVQVLAGRNRLEFFPLRRIMPPMTPEVAGALTRLQSQIRRFPRIALLSPSPEECAFFPEATVLNYADWDMEVCRPDLRFDIIIACHLFQLATEPAPWLSNVTASCRALLLLDFIRRQPSGEPEFGLGGEGVRYAIGGYRPVVANQFDLSSLGSRLLASTVLPGMARGPDSESRLLALIQGQLDAPLIRIDDYPTGVRPVLSDLAPLHALLERFEERRLPFCLGIVPALLNPAMITFLQQLKGCIPALHGYDHGYFRFAPKLAAGGDPYNERIGVRQFNEFRWQFRSTVRRKLTEGQSRLQEILSRSVQTYIPPCNRIDRGTARILAELGFRLCLSEHKVPGGHLPWRRSDFYGNSAQWQEGMSPEVIGLHLTWEWDLQRRGNLESLTRVLDAIESLRTQSRQRVQELATTLASVAPTADNG